MTVPSGPKITSFGMIHGDCNQLASSARPTALHLHFTFLEPNPQRITKGFHVVNDGDPMILLHFEILIHNRENLVLIGDAAVNVGKTGWRHRETWATVESLLVRKREWLGR